MKPAIEEVKEYFKDAIEIESLQGTMFKEVKKIRYFFNDIMCIDENGCSREIWNPIDGYAKILSYKNKPIMKKEFRPIAMRCNQEQFKSVKYKLEKHGIPFGTCHLSILYPYLINHHAADDSLEIGNYKPSPATKYTYETWNEKIFLEACGIEVEETFTISKETILKYDMREEFPDVFEKQDDWFNDTLLSLNDLLSVWCSDNDIERYKTSPLFKSFKELAKTKFKII